MSARNLAALKAAEQAGVRGGGGDGAAAQLCDAGAAGAGAAGGGCADQLERHGDADDWGEAAGADVAADWRRRGGCAGMWRSFAMRW